MVSKKTLSITVLAVASFAANAAVINRSANNNSQVDTDEFHEAVSDAFAPMQGNEVHNTSEITASHVTEPVSEVIPHATDVQDSEITSITQVTESNTTSVANSEPKQEVGVKSKTPEITTSQEVLEPIAQPEVTDAQDSEITATTQVTESDTAPVTNSEPKQEVVVESQTPEISKSQVPETVAQSIVTRTNQDVIKDTQDTDVTTSQVDTEGITYSEPEQKVVNDSQDTSASEMSEYYVPEPTVAPEYKYYDNEEYYYQAPAVTGIPVSEPTLTKDDYESYPVDYRVHVPAPIATNAPVPEPALTNGKYEWHPVDYSVPDSAPIVPGAPVPESTLTNDDYESYPVYPVPAPQTPVIPPKHEGEPEQYSPNEHPEDKPATSYEYYKQEDIPEIKYPIVPNTEYGYDYEPYEDLTEPNYIPIAPSNVKVLSTESQDKTSKPKCDKQPCTKNTEENKEPIPANKQHNKKCKPKTRHVSFPKSNPNSQHHIGTPELTPKKSKCKAKEPKPEFIPEISSEYSYGEDPEYY